MNKESLIKVREFLVNINSLDIPIEDKIELYLNLELLLDPDNYDKHMKVLMQECNPDLRWKKRKGK